MLFLLLFVVFSFVSGQFLMPSYRWTEKGDFLSKTIYGAFLLSRKSGLSIPIVSIEQSDPRIPSKKTTLSTGCADRIARSKNFLKPNRVSHHPRKHTITPCNSSYAGLTSTAAAADAAAAAHSESAWHILFSALLQHVLLSDGSSACYY